MTTIEMKTLEKLCQEQVEILLQKKRLLQRTATEVEEPVETSPNLPHYKTLLPVYETLDYQERFILELEDQIKKEKQKKELKEIYKATASIKLFTEYSPDNPLLHWYNQMITYTNKWTDSLKDGTCGNYVKDCSFFNVKYSNFNEEYEGNALQIIRLSFSTRCHGRCVSMTITAKINSNDLDKYEIVTTNNLGFEGLSHRVKEYLCDGRNAEDFVHQILWQDIRSIIDFIYE